MKAYDHQLYYTNYLRSRVSVITSTLLSLTAVLGAVSCDNVITERLLYGLGCGIALNGLVATSRQEDNRKVVEDVTDISDQTRTNALYTTMNQLQLDYTRQAYNYIVIELGRGTPRDSLLNTLHTDRSIAIQMWRDLETRYGKLPTGSV